MNISMTMLNNTTPHHSRFFMIIHTVILLFFLKCCCYANDNVKDTDYEGSQLLVVPIGVVLDSNSPLDSMVASCMTMALSDFYADHSNYSTRLQLHTKTVDTVLDAYFAVIDLLKNEEVHGIIGPQESTEETFFAELGQRVHVPIISFNAGSPALPYSNNTYFVRTTPDDDLHAKALATICQGFGWSEFALLYEDTDSGTRFMSLLNKAFKEVDISLAYMVAIPNSADDSHILKELDKLGRKQTRVFLVHVSPSLGYRLFPLAKRAEVLTECYAWIVTCSLSVFMDSMDSITHDSMEGVLGMRPYLSRSKDLESFKERWKRNMTMNRNEGSIMELNIYGLWAYDVVTALAIPVEKIARVNSTLFRMTPTVNGTDKRELRILPFGPQLMNELLRTKIRGLSGEFGLLDRRLKLLAFEIFNVVGTGERTVGFWTADRGIVKDLSSIGETSYSTSIKGLKSIMWPGDSLTKPKGWAIPATGKLRVGVPWKQGFREFVHVITDPKTNQINATGFSIAIFLAALDKLPFHINYEFHLHNNTQNPDWSYDDMLHLIPKEYDMVVADTTNWAPRASYVDFSLPYSEPGVVLVVKNKKSFDMWIFVKPLRWDLWLAIIGTCIVMGIVIRILERRVTSSNTDPTRTHEEKPGMIYCSPVAVLAFPERNMVSNNWSFLVLVFWLFMAFILMQSYTANLSAILTVDQLKFAFSDNYYIGCKKRSFVRKFLIDQLHISKSRLRYYSSAEEFHDAISLGSKNGGIDAIFDEIPYMKILLNKYDSQYKMVGPTYRTGGFGFAFSKGSSFSCVFLKSNLGYYSRPKHDSYRTTEFRAGILFSRSTFLEDFARNI